MVSANRLQLKLLAITCSMGICIYLICKTVLFPMARRHILNGHFVCAINVHLVVVDLFVEFVM